MGSLYAFKSYYNFDAINFAVLFDYMTTKSLKKSIS